MKFILGIIITFFSSFGAMLLLIKIQHYDFTCYIIAWTVSAVIMGMWRLFDD